MSDHDPVGRPRSPSPGTRGATAALRGALATARAQHGALSRAQASSLGISESTYRSLRDSWQSPVRGALVLPSSDDAFRGQVRAALLAATGTTVCGTSAARLLDLPGLPAWRPEEPVHLLLPRRGGRRQRRGIRLHFSDLAPADRIEIDGLPVTSPLRTLTDVLLWLDRTSAVCLLDALLHDDRIDDGDLAAIVGAARRRRGGQVCRARLALADGRSESPLETRLRLLLQDAGLPPETLQHVVRDEYGAPIARLDLAWPSRLLDVEADGAGVHGEPAALFRDRRRQNDLTARHWTIVRFTWRDVVGQPDYVVAVVAGHLRKPA